MPDVVQIERYEGPRAEVRWLFQIAEDSAENLDGYINDGQVLVAVLPGQCGGAAIVGAERYRVPSRGRPGQCCAVPLSLWAPQQRLWCWTPSTS